MSVGSLSLRVVLDRPNHLHCGSEDAVTGNVSIFWHQGPKARLEQELFGPLKLVLSFHGRAKTKIWKSNGKTTHTYRGRAPLFQQSIVVHEGAIKIPRGTKVIIPFSVTFPASVQRNLSRDDFTTDKRWNDDVDQLLPPSFKYEYQGFSTHFETFIEYRIGASATMPRIDVDVHNVTKDFEAQVYFSPPKASQPSLAMTQEHIVSRRYQARLRNEYLVPEADRASGFKQKTKAMFKSDYYPLYTFTVITEGSNIVCLGSSLTFEVRIEHEDNPAPGVIVPEITMGNFFTVRIKAFTRVRGEKGIFSCEEDEIDEDVISMIGVQDSKAPFSKANDWTRVVDTKPVSGLPSTFSTFNITRTYVVSICFTVSAAQKDFRIEYKWPLIIAPPVQAVAETDEQVVAGPSSAGKTSGVPQESAGEPLPVYETPPDYEKAAEVAAEDFGAA